jgi:hypothetical protein
MCTTLLIYKSYIVVFNSFIDSKILDTSWFIVGTLIITILIIRIVLLILWLHTNVCFDLIRGQGLGKHSIGGRIENDGASEQRKSFLRDDGNGKRETIQRSSEKGWPGRIEVRGWRRELDNEEGGDRSPWGRLNM